MDIAFDPAKDAANIAMHGLSLARAVELEVLAVVPDARFEEPRFRLFGLIDGRPHCAAVTLREGRVRVISLRRAHRKEIRRHAAQD